MQNNNVDNDEIQFDIKKIFGILKYRKSIIILTFLLITCIFAGLTFILPKKYQTEASLYLNNTNNTNLSELNPFIISDMGGAALSGGGMASLLGNKSSLKNEIEVLKSPLVLNQVIKENGLKYLKGKKKGKFISAKSFLAKDLSFSDLKGTNIINISYKASDPELLYNVVNSIIQNYKKVKRLINLQKTEKDLIFLTESYKETQKELNNQFAKLKLSDAKLYASDDSNLTSYGLHSYYNKNLKQALSSIANKSIDSKKLSLKIEQNIQKLKMIQSKIDWSSLVHDMAKNTSNVIVLKHPEKKEEFEYSEPKLFINVILGIIVSAIVSLMVVFIAEIKDKKLCFSSLGDNIVYANTGLAELRMTLFSKNNEKFSLIYLLKEEKKLLNKLENCNNLTFIDASNTILSMKDLKQSDNVIIVGSLGKTDKKIYKQIKNICKDLCKPVQELIFT